MFDFYDRLKFISKGYASFDDQITDHRAGVLVKMSILVNAELVDAVHAVRRDRADGRGGRWSKAKAPLPLTCSRFPVQAANAGKIIARETIRLCARTSRQVHAATHSKRSCSRSRKPVRRRCASSQGRHPEGSVHRRAQDGS